MQIEEPPARSSGYVSSPPSDECFLCCDDRPGGLVSRVCLCRGVSMHLECQRRMLETAYAAQESSTLDTVLRCGVCHARYSNADARAVWRPSLLGYMWAMCCCGVVIMGWSANTVLERGSSNDPPTDYLDLTWWEYQWNHCTWWRIVGVLYLFISVIMACFSIGWFVLDTCTITMETEPLFIRSWSIRVWKPKPATVKSAITRLRNYFSRPSARLEGEGPASRSTAVPALL